MEEKGFEMVRYADDFVVMCRTEQDATEALALIQQRTATAGLVLHPTKTRLVDEHEHGFDFLDNHFEAGRRSLPVYLLDHRPVLKCGPMQTPGDPVRAMRSVVVPQN